MSLSGPGLAVSASPCVPEQFPPSAFTLTTLLELRSFSLYTAQLENALKYFCVCVYEETIKFDLLSPPVDSALSAVNQDGLTKLKSVR